MSQRKHSHPFPWSRFFLPAALVIAAPLLAQGAEQLSVEASNPLQLARPSQTLELSAADLAPLGETNLQKIHIRDAAGKEVICQAVDTDFDPYHLPDIVVFQADFAPGETKTFTVTVGTKQVHTAAQFKAHGRFVRERFDDFAWENDRIAHRMYGKALETWAGEPLTSSTVDIWSKRVPQMVIDEWYMTDDYHADHGQGADFYSAGASRGCGGNGLWADGKLWVSKNFVDSRVLANGPIRVMFELVYEPFEVNGRKVAEVKRITLDAGSNLDRFESLYKPADGGAPLVSGVGLKKVSGQELQFNRERGWLTAWEKVAKNQGMQGLGIVADPAIIEGQAEDRLNHLLLLKTTVTNTVSYRAGFVWDKSGQFSDFAAWQKYLDETAQMLQSPVRIKVTPSTRSASSAGGTMDPDPAKIGKLLAENFLARTLRAQADAKKASSGIIYPEVCAWYGSLTVAQLTKDKDLQASLIKKFDPLLTEAGNKLINRSAHVDYRVFGVVPLEIYLQTRDERYLKLGLELADKQWENPTPDGITREARYWVDDMYMITAVQVQAFRATSQTQYLDRAALTVFAYLDKLQQSNGLFYHAPDVPFFWGRGNGWFAAGMTELLRVLPPSHPRHARILQGYRTMMAALLKYQGADGLWRQLLDKPESWPETSCTGMFAFALTTGVKQGWLDEPTYGPAARKAWLGLVSYLNPNGDIREVCEGTNKKNDYQYYLDRGRKTGDLHGQAPVLWTASALLR